MAFNKLLWRKKKWFNKLVNVLEYFNISVAKMNNDSFSTLLIYQRIQIHTHTHTSNQRMCETFIRLLIFNQSLYVCRCVICHAHLLLLSLLLLYDPGKRMSVSTCMHLQRHTAHSTHTHMCA